METLDLHKTVNGNFGLIRVPVLENKIAMLLLDQYDFFMAPCYHRSFKKAMMMITSFRKMQEEFQT